MRPPQTGQQTQLWFFSGENALGKTFLALEKPKKTLDKTQQKTKNKTTPLHQISNFT
jgi:hypothetical protein